MTVDLAALVKEIYADCDAKKRGWSRHKSKEQRVSKRLPVFVKSPVVTDEDVPIAKLPPLVHAPCERRSFDPEATRARATEWLFINLDSHDERVVH